MEVFFGVDNIGGYFWVGIYLYFRVGFVFVDLEYFGWFIVSLFWSFCIESSCEGFGVYFVLWVGVVVVFELVEGF